MMISSRAIKGFFNPKNKKDQIVFNINCIAKKRSAFLTNGFVSILSQIIPPEIPIKI